MRKYQKPTAMPIDMNSEDLLLSGSVNIGISDDPATQPQRTRAFNTDWSEEEEDQQQ